MFPRHYSEERLIEYLDGEMPWWRALAAARHLHRCWECRALCDGLREETRALVAVYRRSEPLDGNRVAAARARFHEWEARASAAGARQPPPIRFLGRAPALVGFGALAVFAAAGLWIEMRPPAPAPVTAVKPAPAASPPPAPVPVSSRAPRPEPEIEAPRPAVDWTGAMLRAELILHELGLCLENSVHVAVDRETLRFTGAVQSGDAARRLRERVSEALPEVEVALEVHSVEEFAAESAGDLVSGAGPQTPSQKPAGPPLESVIRAKLRKRGAAGRDAADETNRVLVEAVRLAEQAWSEAWAVRRLAARFPAPVLVGMTARQRSLVAGMARDHLDGLHAAVAGGRRTLAPYLDFPAAPQPIDDALLPASVDRIQRLVETLCSGPEFPAAPVEPLAQELASLLASTEAALVGGGLLSRDWESLAALYEPARPR